MENASALVTLVLYGAVLLGVGLWTARRARNEAAFLLGERSLGPIVAGLAYAASSSSAWVLLGFTGFVYVSGPSAMWMLPGILVGYALVWYWAGPMLQRSSREKGHLTLTDFLTENASAGTAKIIRFVAALMIGFCFSYYVAGQFQGAGAAIDGLFNSGIALGVVIGATIIVAYTFLGGFLAVSLIDTLQGLLIGVVALILPAAAFMHAGGFEGVNAMLNEAPEAYRASFGTRSGFIALGFAFGLSATGFGALGQPHLLAWVMAAKDKRARLTGGAIAIGWAAMVFLGMGVLGLSARAIFGAEENPEQVFFLLSDVTLPGVFAGIVAAATLSAIMSTVDSQLLVAGAAIAHDGGLGNRLGGRHVLVSRAAILAVSLIAVVMTLVAPASLFERILFAWTALGAAFGPIVIARVIGIRFSGGSALVAMLAGFSACLAYEFWIAQGPGGLWMRTVPWAISLAIMALGPKSKAT